MVPILIVIGLLLLGGALVAVPQAANNQAAVLPAQTWPVAQAVNAHAAPSVSSGASNNAGASSPLPTAGMTSLSSQFHAQVSASAYDQYRQACQNWSGAWLDEPKVVGCRGISLPLLDCGSAQLLPAKEACAKAGGTFVCDPWNLFCTVN